MRNTRIAGFGAGMALAAGLLLAGCGAPAPQDRIVAVTPPVVAVTPAGPSTSASSATAQTFQSTIGMTPLESQGIMRLQSFAGDVCVADSSSGSGSVSHCICQQNNCNCQSTGASCNP